MVSFTLHIALSIPKISLDEFVRKSEEGLILHRVLEICGSQELGRVGVYQKDMTVRVEFGDGEFGSHRG